MHNRTSSVAPGNQVVLFAIPFPSGIPPPFDELFKPRAREGCRVNRLTNPLIDDRQAGSRPPGPAVHRRKTVTLKARARHMAAPTNGGEDRAQAPLSSAASQATRKPPRESTGRSERGASAERESMAAIPCTLPLAHIHASCRTPAQPGPPALGSRSDAGIRRIGGVFLVPLFRQPRA